MAEREKVRHHIKNAPFSGVAPELHEPVWRFMDTAKYLSILATSSIPLIRADRFEDRFEGTIPALSQDDIRQRINEIAPASRHSRGAGELCARLFELLERRDWVIKRAHISSWYLQRHDTSNMWKAYAGSGNAIAIQSTYGSLAQALDPDLDIGRVRYIDFDKERLDGSAELSVFSHKRLYFRDEHELRVLKIDMRMPSGYQVPDIDPPVVIPWVVDLSSIVKAVVISPFANDWFRIAIEDLTEKYGLASGLVVVSKIR